MSRMQISAAKTLMTNAEVGGFTLPTELTDAYRVHQQLMVMTIPEPEAPHVEALAAQFLARLGDNLEADLLVFGRTLADADVERNAYLKAGTVLAAAREQAADRLTTLARDMATQIITDHLAPAHAKLLAQVADVAAALDGYGLDPHSLVTAPAKARNAYAKLPDLVAARAAILAARRSATAAGEQQPQHDHSDLYASFKNPLAFHPTWSPGGSARFPGIPWPESPTESLLWLASPAAAKAQPWLPTVAEQDAAYREAFKDAGLSAQPWSRVVANA